MERGWKGVEAGGYRRGWQPPDLSIERFNRRVCGGLVVSLHIHHEARCSALISHDTTMRRRTMRMRWNSSSSPSSGMISTNPSAVSSSLIWMVNARSRSHHHNVLILYERRRRQWPSRGLLLLIESQKTHRGRLRLTRASHALFHWYLRPKGEGKDSDISHSFLRCRWMHIAARVTQHANVKNPKSNKDITSFNLVTIKVTKSARCLCAYLVCVCRCV